MKLVLIIARHGKTALNHEDKSKDRIRGHKDVSLNQEGIDEAQRLARELRTANFFKIYSSDLSRAYKTAQMINRYHDVALIKTESLRPMNLGIFEGKVTKDVLPRMIKYFENETLTVPEGESFKRFRLRTLKFIKEAITEAQKKKMPILLSTHYRVLKLVEAWMKKGMPDDMTVDVDEMKKDGVKTGELLEVKL